MLESAAREYCGEHMDNVRVVELVISSLKDGLIVIGENGKVLLCNNAAEKLLRIDARDYLGKPLDLFDNDLVQMVDMTWLTNGREEAVARTKDTPRVDLVVRSETGERRIEARLFPVGRDPDLCGTGMLLRDVTAERDESQIKDEFASMVAHELKSPLTVIIGALRTVLADTGRLRVEDERQLITDAVAQGELMNELVCNLLDLSRADANRLNLHNDPIDMTELIKAVIEKMQGLYPEHRFLLSVGNQLPPVRGDEVRLGRVVYNLLDNAAKYSPAGSAVETFGRVENGELIIGVKDQGQGIAPEDQAILFEPFQRLGRNVGGTGIGLVVCRRLVEAHRGKIWVESEPGTGSTFFFSLPMAN